MPIHQQQHPSQNQLMAFGMGKLSDEESQQIESHVEQCESCCQALQAMQGDTFMSLARGAATQLSSLDLQTQVLERGPSETETREEILPEELAEHSRYRIVTILGHGGMGTVYRAEHRLMERTVAVKVIHQRFLRHRSAIERFKREVKAAAKLSHRNIVAAFDAEQAGDHHFLVMEYVEGLSLDRLIAKQGPLEPIVALKLIRQAALGLQHAHEQGMVHRDIKPQNIMVTRKGLVKVLDFGLARLASESLETIPAEQRVRGVATQGQTEAGTFLGTPDYIAPEQAFDARSVDIRSDIYSLGATLVFALLGRPPFPNGTLEQKVNSHRWATPPDLRTLNTPQAEAIARLVEQMMAKSPADRPATPAKVAEQLLPIINQLEKSPSLLEKNLSRIKKLGEGQSFAKVAQWWKGISTSKRAWLPAVILASLLALIAVIPLMLWGGSYLGQLDRVLNNFASMKSLPLLTASAEKEVVLVVSHSAIWPNDYIDLRKSLERRGVRVTTASWEKGLCTPHHTYKGEPVEIFADRTIEEVLAQPKPPNAVVFVGGDTSRLQSGPTGEQVRQLVSKVSAEKQVVGAICVGQSVLIAHGMLVGKTAAYGRYHQQYLGDGGANWCHEHEVVIDRTAGYPIITAANDDNGSEFADRICDEIFVK